MRDDTIFFFSAECWPALIDGDTVFMHLPCTILKLKPIQAHTSVLLKCSPQKSDNMISQEFCMQNQELILKFE